MSPVGLDSREFSFAILEYVTPNGLTHILRANDQGWLVTRIQCFAGPLDTVVLTIGGNPLNIAASGCIELWPGGTLRGSFSINGDGATLIVEYWYKNTAAGTAPSITIT
jgi:hypothetical protein